MNKQKTIISKHEFALYLEHLSSAATALKKNNSFVVDDQDLVHRITHILRLTPEETVILFDRTGHITFRIDEITKKRVNGTLIDIAMNNQLQPPITFFYRC